MKFFLCLLIIVTLQCTPIHSSFIDLAGDKELQTLPLQTLSRVESAQIPRLLTMADCSIISHPDYNIDLQKLLSPSFPIVGKMIGWGLAKVVKHYSFVNGFDFNKWGKVADHMASLDIPIVTPETMVSYEQLGVVHTPEYLASLSNPATVAQILAPIFEQGALFARVSANRITRYLLNPMRLTTMGTILAVQKAMAGGPAIHIGGGMHHAYPTHGEGFCMFGDIPLAIYTIRQSYPNLKVMVIDTDIHASNGIDCMLQYDPLSAIFDIRNYQIYPYDAHEYEGGYAPQKFSYSYDHAVPIGITTPEYLRILRRYLPGALDDLRPDLIIHNAGTDPYMYDSIGGAQIDLAGMIAKDEYVARIAHVRGIKFAMVTSGGYSPASPYIHMVSFENLLCNVWHVMPRQSLRKITKRIKEKAGHDGVDLR